MIKLRYISLSTSWYSVTYSFFTTRPFMVMPNIRLASSSAS